MTNTYFNHTSPFARFTTADAIRLNSTLKAVEAGFDKLPSATELIQGSRDYSVATNIGGAYSVTLPYTITSYPAGMTVAFFAAVANPVGATLSVNAIGFVTLKRFDGTNLIEGDIKENSLNTVTSDGTNFRLTSMHGSTDTLAATSSAAAATSASQAATSASSALTSANSASVSATTASTASTLTTSTLTGARFGFRNLLVNAQFWMSQYNGLTFGGTTASGYFLRDRWKAGTLGSTWSMSDSVLTIASGSVIQIVQGRNIRETGIHTLSWVGSATASINGTAIANGGQTTLTRDLNATVQFSSGTVSKPQLEYSPVKTQFEFRPVDIERIICFQYYQKSYDEFTIAGAITEIGGVYNTARDVRFFNHGTIHMPMKMRGIPAITVFSPATGLSGKGSITGVRDAALTIANVSPSSFNMYSSSDNLITDFGVLTQWIADAEI